MEIVSGIILGIYAVAYYSAFYGLAEDEVKILIELYGKNKKVRRRNTV